jgi:protein-S-isoprenylcysteine O-methyltransferase Ste14
MSQLENRFPPPLLVLAIGVAMAGIAWNSTALSIPWVARLAIGSAIIALGAGTVVTGARTFWRAGTTINPVDIKQASALVTSGLFGYTRNPMYVGFTLMLIGWGVALASPWAMMGPVAFVLFIHRFQINPEEQVIRAKFGNEYEQSCKRVRRWI